MPETPKNDLRPYQLPRAEYGLWYEVGERLGMMAQLAVEGMLCHGQQKLQCCVGSRMQTIDERSLTIIEEIARRRQVALNKAV